METIDTLRACIATMEKMSVAGFDNADRYVGVIQTLRMLVKDLENRSTQHQEETE